MIKGNSNWNGYYDKNKNFFENAWNFLTDDFYEGSYGNRRNAELSKEQHEKGFDLKTIWDNFVSGRTNEVNKEIADENLAYQAERNDIEDNRYAEETSYNRSFAEQEQVYNRAFAEEEQAYNRAFAEDEREYNRALQQQLFEREDTSMLRQANQLSQLGINPITQNLNGLNDSVVSSSAYSGSSAPVGVGVPSSSGRGGSALNNGFQMQSQGLMSLLSPMMNFADTINGLKTGSYQRDSLLLQNQSKQLDNAFKNLELMDKAHKMGLKTYRYGIPKNIRNDFNSQIKWEVFDQGLFDNALGSDLYKDSMENLKNKGLYNLADTVLTKGSSLVEEGLEDGFTKNLLKQLFNLFGY